MIPLACGYGNAWSQGQKVAITSCSTNPAPFPGYECGKAYDGNSATEWRAKAAAGTSQLIQFNMGTLRRIKKISVNWSVAPNSSRTYMTIDKTGSWRLAAYLTGSQTTDIITLPWGEDLTIDEDNMMWTSQAVVIEVYTSAVAGLKEINLYGPGIYSDEQILTRTVPIGAWNIIANSCISITPSPVIDFSRLVGASAFLFGDDNSVHNLTALVPYPANTYTYSGGGPTGGAGSHNQGGLSMNSENNSISLCASQYQGHANFDDAAKNPRGYVTLRFLSQNPDFAP